MKTAGRFIIVALAAIVSAAGASAGTLTGAVHNGTTNTPVAGVEVVLLQLQGGMQAVATTKADAQGRFQFDRPEIGAQPMLLRVQYRGVNYHQPVPPGMPTTNVEVFDNTQNPGAIQVTTHAIVLQPNTQSLLIGEEFTIQNQTHPPVAFYRADGTFTFTIPDGAQLNQVTAFGSAGMPVVQGTIDKGKNTSAIAYAFRPGENGVRLSYQVPYPSNETTIHSVSPYAAQRVLVIVPPTVQVLSVGFQPAGTEQGYNIYERDNIAPSLPLDIAVSGTAPPPSAAGNESQQGGEAQNPSVNSRAGEGAESNVHVMPGRIEDLRWILVGGFALIFVLGAVFLLRKPQQTADSAQAAAQAGAARQPAREPKSAKVPAPAAAEPVLAEMDRQVHGSLDEIKENLFRLELRRQAGTISEEEYSLQRGRAEKTLRDVLRG